MRRRKYRAGSGSRGVLSVFLSIALLSAGIIWGYSLIKNNDLPLPVTNQTTPQPTQTAEPTSAPQDTSSGEASLWQRIFSLSPESMLAMELPAAKGVDAKASESDDPYWAMEDESSDPQTTQQASSDDSALPLTPVLSNITSSDPQILIYCTHSNEAFNNTGEYAYTECSKWNTLDTNNNILRVAGKLASEMSGDYGLPVLFDNTDHELGKYYTTSYNRSLETIEKDKEKYSSLKVFLDIHRDATSEAAGADDYVVIDGKKCARVMVVIGTGEGKTGAGFAVKPNWQENLKFAKAITEALRAINPGLVREVRINTGRYNQHVSTEAVAIEIGHNINTIDMALNSTPYLAKALSAVLKGE